MRARKVENIHKNWKIYESLFYLHCLNLFDQKLENEGKFRYSNVKPSAALYSGEKKLDLCSVFQQKNFNF